MEYEKLQNIKYKVESQIMNSFCCIALIIMGRKLNAKRKESIMALQLQS